MQGQEPVRYVSQLRLETLSRILQGGYGMHDLSPFHHQLEQGLTVCCLAREDHYPRADSDRSGAIRIRNDS